MGKWYVGGKPLRRGYLEIAAPLGDCGAGDKPVKLTRSGTGHEISWDIDRCFQDPDGKPRTGFGIGLTPPTDDRVTAEAIDSLTQRRSRLRAAVQVLAKTAIVLE